LAAPSPTISWFGSTGVRKRAACARQHARVGKRDERNRGAAREHRHDVVEAQQWNCELRQTLRQVPSTDTLVPRSNAATITVAVTTAIRMPGTRGRREHEDQRERAAADRERDEIRAARGDLLDDGRCLAQRALRVDLGTEQLGIWLSSTVSAMPFI
jgi:hypothetical protein